MPGNCGLIILLPGRGLSCWRSCLPICSPGLSWRTLKRLVEISEIHDTVRAGRPPEIVLGSNAWGSRSGVYRPMRHGYVASRMSPASKNREINRPKGVFIINQGDAQSGHACSDFVRATGSRKTYPKTLETWESLVDIVNTIDAIDTSDTLFAELFSKLK